MEFLRFGSIIPGLYHGCCACDIIQNFKFDPDTSSSIEIVHGDSGTGLNGQFVGKTYREIFWQRIRFGTFSQKSMPNHAFIAILTQNQIAGSYGAAWLAILKEAGFEFIRTVTNSVYTGDEIIKKPGQTGNAALNHIFMMVRNIGVNGVADPYTPPKEWRDLPSMVPEAWQYISDSGNEQTRANGASELAVRSQEAQLSLWKKLPKATWFTKAQLTKAEVPVILAGQRSKRPQQNAAQREAMIAAEEAAIKRRIEAAINNGGKEPERAANPFLIATVGTMA